MNAQGFTSEAKDVILSLCKVSCLYTGNFYIRCDTITGCPSGDSLSDANEIHSQLCDECTGIYL